MSYQGVVDTEKSKISFFIVILTVKDPSNFNKGNVDCKKAIQSTRNIHLHNPIEILNNIREGLPQHELKLKINSIVMLIRNIRITDGLCNGTRLKIVIQ